MKKIMFDSNIFDKLQYHLDVIHNTKVGYEYYVTTVQIQELCNIPDAKADIRTRNITILADLRARIVKTSVSIVGECAKVGYTRIGQGKTYNQILKDSKNNVEDSVIADTSVAEGCTLVTDDGELYNRMKRNKHDVMYFSEFLETL